MLNLDTHILLHAMTGDLKAPERKLLSAHAWGISAIVLWEIAKLVRLGRVLVEVDSAEFQQYLSKVHLWPIDWAVARRSTELDFEGDPADELIAATSIVHGVLLVTRDERIRSSKIVPLAR